MKIHPVAEMFPMLSQVEYEALRDNIEERGQLVPVIVSKNVLLDGRNRLKACEELGKEPWVQEWEGTGGTETEFILSLNLYRRHLTDSQRAMVVSKASDHIKRENEERRKTTQFQEGTVPNPDGRKGKEMARQDSDEPIRDYSKENKHSTAGRVAKIAKVSRYKAQQALKLAKESPELADKVAAGDLTLGKATQQLNESRSTTKEETTNGTAPTASKPKPDMSPAAMEKYAQFNKLIRLWKQCHTTVKRRFFDELPQEDIELIGSKPLDKISNILNNINKE